MRGDDILRFDLQRIGSLDKIGFVIDQEFKHCGQNAPIG